tara:strand:+ start:364 stop:1269 length:906 start_codon:yes stop_codon:yes gene_type:complete
MVNPVVSILIITWNRKDILKKNLAKIILREEVPIEVIVVDNNSDDGTEQMLNTSYSNCRYFKMSKNQGIRAYNIGASQARGKYLLLLDDDSYPASGSVTKMVELFEEQPDVGIIPFNILHHETKEEYRTWHIPQISGRVEAVNFLGCGAGIRSELFKKAGYYPECFFIYENELDVSLKVLQQGHKIIYDSTIIAYHDFSSNKRGTPNQIFYGSKNKLLLLWKYFPAKIIILSTIEFFLSSILLSFKKGFCLLRWKAWLFALVQLPGYLKEYPFNGNIHQTTIDKLKPLLQEFKLKTWLKRL